ncbi:hypothetical protein T07_5562 [Trichinella nelsoni]|uniref:PiggyBac transposable element-derived protein domain-containing protein n=1 Tax=Trichinella nelsoni TaxID=6336 RepID=A0A0V0S7S8_9BILA|nr:hypothetical protein T07_5562 [Trichinella nelsoni]
MVGTLRKNESDISPKIAITKGLPFGSSHFGLDSKLTLLNYVSTKNRCILLLSTMPHDKKVCPEEDNKPEIVLSYNDTKSGVDNWTIGCGSTPISDGIINGSWYYS